MKKVYYLSLKSENTLRVLQRIATVFSRNRINIKKLNVCESEAKNISYFSIIIYADNKVVEKIVKQLRRIIELQDVRISNTTSMLQERWEDQQVQTV